MPFSPTPKATYNTVCPSCFNPIQFVCETLYNPYTTCNFCHVTIDLQNVSVAPSGLVESGANSSGKPIEYSDEVELMAGCAGSGGSALDQVTDVLLKAQNDLNLPTIMSEESGNAVREERVVSIHQKLWPLFFVTYIVEFFLFGRNQRFTRIGHIRVYRKKIPFLGYRYIPAPRTSTSYSSLSIIVFFFFLCACYAVHKCQDQHIRKWLYFLFPMMLILYTNMLIVTYSDPGFILPGYISGDTNAGPRVLDRAAILVHQQESVVSSIENDKKESQWEQINDVPMERKWCAQCKHFRPVRAAHCYQCGLCVAVHDHHCVVTGGCVGERNILFFTFFVTQGFCAAGLAGFVTFMCLIAHPSSFSLDAYIFLILFDVLFCWFLTLMAISLACGLWYDLFVNTTTRERLTNVYQFKRNPFSLRWYTNICNVFKKKREMSIFREEIVSLVAGANDKGAAVLL